MMIMLKWFKTATSVRKGGHIALGARFDFSRRWRFTALFLAEAITDSGLSGSHCRSIVCSVLHLVRTCESQFKRCSASRAVAFVGRRDPLRKQLSKGRMYAGRLKRADVRQFLRQAVQFTTVDVVYTDSSWIARANAKRRRQPWTHRLEVFTILIFAMLNYWNVERRHRCPDSIIEILKGALRNRIAEKPCCDVSSSSRAETGAS